MVETSVGPVHLDGAGPLVIVLPSIGRGAGELAPFAAALAGHGLRVARPEPVVPEGATLDDLAAGVAALVGTLGAERAVIAGHAFGNWVARLTAVRHPERVAGIAIVAAAARAWPRRLIADVETSADPAESPAARLAALGRAFFARGNDPAPWLDGWDRVLLERQKAAGASVPQAEWWGAGRAPLLDLQAEEDPFRPEASRYELAEAFPGRVAVATVAGASHALPFERPRETAAAIALWMRGLH